MGKIVFVLYLLCLVLVWPVIFCGWINDVVKIILLIMLMYYSTVLFLWFHGRWIQSKYG